MKIKTKLLLGLSIIAALCIGFLAGILIKLPPVDDSAAAGTFGKAEKFRKVQMTDRTSRGSAISMQTQRCPGVTRCINTGKQEAKGKPG